MTPKGPQRHVHQGPRIASQENSGAVLVTSRKLSSTRDVGPRERPVISLEKTDHRVLLRRLGGLTTLRAAVVLETSAIRTQSLLDRHRRLVVR